MNCRHADEMIQRALDEALAPRERRELDAHLKDCAACRAADEAYRRLTREATVWTRRPAEEAGNSDAFAARVLARIAEDASTPAASPLGERGWLRPLAGLGLAFGVLALLCWYFGPGVLPALPPSSADLLPRPQTAFAVPGWLWANLRALPGDAVDAWTRVQISVPQIAGLRPALVLALIANGLLVAHATRQQPSRNSVAG